MVDMIRRIFSWQGLALIVAVFLIAYRPGTAANIVSKIVDLVGKLIDGFITILDRVV